MLKRQMRAFSLIETALVLSILGIVSAYAIPALLQVRTAARWRETDAKIESAIYALASYAQVEQRLPYPADPAAVEENAGNEQSGRITGILPYRTLGIQGTDAKDGFHHWISYSVSQDLTADLKHFARQKKTSGGGGARYSPMDINDNGNAICHVPCRSWRLDVHNVQGQSMFELSRHNDFIAFVLVSHGPTGAGSFDDAGQRRSATGDKLRNLGMTPFIDRSVTKDYDDRVRWMSRNNLMAMYAKQPCKPIG